MNKPTTNNDNRGEQSRKRGNNFDSVPADDGFRNYMSRKIELQWKQFGLVVPPPPQPSPPSEILLTTSTCAKTSKSEPNSHSTVASSTSNHACAEKKSVRFHDNVEVEGVSQLLSNLKQKYTEKKKISRLSSSYKRRRLRQILDEQPMDSNNTGGPAAFDNNSQLTSFAPSSNGGFSSVLGVLNKLQQRYGTSSIVPKKVDNDENSQETQGCSVGSEGFVDIESLEFNENGNPVSSSSMSRFEGGGHTGSAGVQSKKRRESPRCNGVSVLELLGPDESESIGDILNDQQCPANQLLDNSQGISTPAISRRPQYSSSLSPSPIYDSQSNCPRNITSSTSVNSLSTKVGSTATKLVKKQNHRPDLFFHGIVVLVNGHTSPDATTLMRLLHKHGGDLEKYETQRVTHIIAEQLSAAKAKIYKQQRKPTPVVRPQWIVESVDRGTLLPFGNYILENVLNDDVARTKSVKSFFSKTPDQTNATTPTESVGPTAESCEHHGFESAEKIPSLENFRGDNVTDETKSHRWQDTHPSQANYHLHSQVRTVGNDPNFLESYFQNSRLSYIGSFKQRIKPTKQTRHSQSKEGSRKFVLLVDMDYFFAAVALRKYPQYRNKPVAVGHSNVTKSQSSESRKTKSSSELSTCNYIARNHGVRKGMFLGDAIQLCPDLIVLPYDFEGFEEVSGIVSNLLDGFAEQYNGCTEQVSCDESYVEINLNQDDFDGNDIYEFVHDLAEHFRAEIFNKTECTASIGVGPNKMLAKLAAERVKPDASHVVKDWREFLSGRDLRDIPGIGRKLEKKLHQHALRTVNDIWELEDDAVNVLGDVIGHGNAQKIVQFCYGKDNRLVTPTLRKSIGAECNYGVRFDGPYGVDYMMKGLAREVMKRMTEARFRGAKLTLKIMKSTDPSKVPGKFLGHGLCDSFSRSVNISLTRDDELIYSAAMKLHQKLGIDDSSIRGMGIVISSLKSDDDGVDGSPSSPSKLSAWLKRDISTPSESRSLEGQKSPQGACFEVEPDDSSTPVIAAADSDRPSNPTFSQLDQDVLRSLPDDILSEVRNMYGKSSREHTSHGTMSPPTSQKAKSVGNVSAKDKPIPIVGQASVRRMLKLACVKLGAEILVGNRLSQLECLPLEVQLQIANEDDVTITKRPKQKASTADHSSSTNEMAHAIQTQLKSEITYPDESNGFYHDNIAPLREFISCNPNPDNMTVNTVRDFLSVCVREQRIDDAVVFLRTIKNMHACGWGGEIYLQLRKSTSDTIYYTTGSVLDENWLGL